MSRICFLFLVAALMAACAPEPAESETESATEVAQPFFIRPDSLSVPDTVNGLVVQEIESEQLNDSLFVGRFLFSGELVLQGTYVPHPDFPENATPCLEVDSASARQLPRFRNDERRPWLCFTNAEEAVALLGPVGERRPVAVVVDTFTYHYQFSDVYNTAHLLRVE